MAFEKFVSKKSLPAAVQEDDCSELERRTGLNELNLVYYGDKSGDLYDAFKKAGKSPLISKNYSFYNSVNPVCAIETLGQEILRSGQTSFLGLIRSFDESPLMYDGENS